MFPRTAAAIRAMALQHEEKRSSQGSNDAASAQARVDELTAELDGLFAAYDRQQAHVTALEQALDALRGQPAEGNDVMPKAIPALEAVHAEAMMQFEATGTMIVQTEDAIVEYEAAVASYDEPAA